MSFDPFGKAAISFTIRSFCDAASNFGRILRGSRFIFLSPLTFFILCPSRPRKRTRNITNPTETSRALSLLRQLASGSPDAYEMPIAADGGSPDAGKRVWYRAGGETFVVGTAAVLLAYLVGVVLRASWLDHIGHFTNNTGHADKIATA
jgi:hypothetical protein